MRLTNLEAEADVGALVDRLYANLTPKSRKLAQTAMLKANPQLARAEAFRPGVVVNLPQIPGLKIRPDAKVGQDPVEQVLGRLKDAVSRYREQLAKTSEATLTNFDRQEELLKQEEVAAAIKSEPPAIEIAKNLTASLRERRKAIAADGKRLDATFNQIVKDLESLEQNQGDRN